MRQNILFARQETSPVTQEKQLAFEVIDEVCRWGNTTFYKLVWCKATWGQKPNDSLVVLSHVGGELPASVW